MRICVFCSKPSLDTCLQNIFTDLKKEFRKIKNIEFLVLKEENTLENLYFSNLKNNLEKLREKLKFKGTIKNLIKK